MNKNVGMAIDGLYHKKKKRKKKKQGQKHFLEIPGGINEDITKANVQCPIIHLLLTCNFILCSSFLIIIDIHLDKYNMWILFTKLLVQRCNSLARPTL
jgi:hypothetical protein